MIVAFGQREFLRFTQDDTPIERYLNAVKDLALSRSYQSVAQTSRGKMVMWLRQAQPPEAHRLTVGLYIFRCPSLSRANFRWLRQAQQPEAHRLSNRKSIGSPVWLIDAGARACRGQTSDGFDRLSHRKPTGSATGSPQAHLYG